MTDSSTYVTRFEESVRIAEGTVHATTIPTIIGTRYIAKMRNIGRNGLETILLKVKDSGYKYSLVETKPHNIAIDAPDVTNASVANLIQERSEEKMKTRSDAGNDRNAR